MKHSISNGQLEVSVLSTGAEISNIKSIKSGKEYMWDADPEVWGSHAPVLFPTIGSLKNDECTIEGKSYTIPKHGFIRNNNDLILKSKTDEELVFQLDYSEDTLLIYPYKFSFTISYKLEGNALIVSHKVENFDDSTIHFALGAHPGFKCPMNEGEVYSDYYLEFEKKETTALTLLSDDGLVSDRTESLLEDSSILNLHNDIFINDALILKDLESRKVSLKSHKSDQVLTVAYSDFPYLGLWAKPNAPFVCIEPWIGTADHESTDGDFLKKDQLIALPKGEIFNASYTIDIEE